MGGIFSINYLPQLRLQRLRVVSRCLGLLAITSCGGDTETVSLEGGAAGGGLSADNASLDIGPRVELTTVLHECVEGEPLDPIYAHKLQWEDDTLTVEGGHSGGCAEHQYGLCYTARQKAIVLNLTLTLLHDSGGDHCEAYFGTGPLSFDLAPLYEEYEELFSLPSWEVMIRLQDQKLFRIGEGFSPESENPETGDPDSGIPAP